MSNESLDERIRRMYLQRDTPVELPCGIQLWEVLEAVCQATLTGAQFDMDAFVVEKSKERDQDGSS